MIRYAIALAVLLAVAALFSWAFLLARYLPGNRVSYLRLRQVSAQVYLGCTYGGPSSRAGRNLPLPQLPSHRGH
jgi:hypothetical protein